MNLTIILVISLVCLIPNKIAMAATAIPDWGVKIENPITTGLIYNWSSGTEFDERSSAYEEIALSSLDGNSSSPIYALTSSSNVTTATNGISLAYLLNQSISSDYVYSITTYICADFNLGLTNGLKSPYASSDTGYPGVILNNPIYSYTASSSLSSNAFYVNTVAFSSCRQYTTIIQPSYESRYFALKFTSTTSVTGKYYVLGYNIESLGIASNVISSQISSIVKNSGLATAESVNEVNDAVDEVKTEVQVMQEEQEKTNNKLDEQTQQDKEQHEEIMNSDISEEDKELPDDSKYQDYNNTENDLKDKVNEADMSVISIGIDAKSSSWIWNTLTNLIKSHSAIFGMFIAILSIGIIKLALGR